MQLQQIWKQEYLKNRYCQSITLPELYQRIQDVFKLICTITPDGKIGLAQVDGPYGFACKAWSDLMVELSLRGIDYREPAMVAATRGITVPSARMPQILAAIAGVPERVRTGHFVKYGKELHLQNSLQKGLFRLSNKGAPRYSIALDSFREAMLILLPEK